MTPYLHFVSELARLVRQGRQFPLGGFAPPSRPVIAADAPRALIFSPHPDDECIIGGLALRLQREAGLRVVNVAVTQGSNKARQAARWDELTAACDYLGFDLVATVPGGLEHVNVRTRAADPAHWSASVEVIARLLGEHRPAPDVNFCTLYRLREWRDGALHFVHDGGRALPASVNVRDILPVATRPD
jgi:N-acetylglucosamine malate deacetylase 1